MRLINPPDSRPSQSNSEVEWERNGDVAVNYRIRKARVVI
eukprot:COSAG02_NODE_832_length_16660_cov_16.228006_21_plen_40_part_00